ncbi:class I SAM-dependent methyltransferase [Actinomycetospora sp. C-140]
MREVTPVDGLPLTGERTVPGLDVENYWFRRHEAVYLALAAPCADRVVLDAGVGEGYGAALLASSARRVVALELDAAVAAYVGARYRSVAVARADLQVLPVADRGVDAVVTLQVIEHLWDQPGFLAECARVLRPGGRLYCATPNRLTFSPGAGPEDRPLNPFHTRELTGAELASLVTSAGLSVESLLGLHHGPALRALDARHGGSLVDAQVALALSGEVWPETLAADVAAVTAADFDLRADDLDGSLDLLVTAVRPA